MITHTKETHGMVESGGLGTHSSLDVLQEMRPVTASCGVGGCDAEGQMEATVRRLPPESLPGQHFLVKARTHEDVGFKAALLEDLRKCARVAEAIHTIRNARLNPQVLAHIGLAQEELSHEGLPLWQIHVGLNDHAVHHVPPALADELDDLGEQLGVLVLNPLVYLGLAPYELEVGVLAQSIYSRAASSQCLGPAFGPTPEPDRIQVSLANHVHYGLRHLEFTHLSQRTLSPTSHTGRGSNGCAVLAHGRCGEPEHGAPRWPGLPDDHRPHR